MNQQSSSKHVSGRQGKSWSDQSMNVLEKTVSGRSAEGAGAELEKRRVPAAPSVPEAATVRDGKKNGELSFNEFLLSMPKDDQPFERITLKVREIEW